MVPTIVVLALLIPIIAIVLDSDVGRAIARRLERGSRRADPGAEDDLRLRLVESEVERLSREVARLGEESQFLHRLLADGSEERALRPPGDQAEGRIGTEG